MSAVPVEPNISTASFPQRNVVHDADGQSAPSVCPDLPVLLGMLLTSGFRVKYSDKGDRGGASGGCRAIIICKRSGTRVVMDGEGPCTCPPEETLNRYLHPGGAGQVSAMGVRML